VVFEVVNREVLVLEVVVLVVGLKSQQVVSLLGVLPLVFSTGMGGAVALRWRGGMVHCLPFVVLVLLQLERVGSLIRVTMVVLSLLDVLHLVINTSLGEVAVLSLRRATDHTFPFVVEVPFQWDKSGLPMVVLGLTGWIAVLIGMVR
jgi:hypothetical protein